MYLYLYKFVFCVCIFLVRAFIILQPWCSLKWGKWPFEISLELMLCTFFSSGFKLRLKNHFTGYSLLNLCGVLSNLGGVWIGYLWSCWSAPFIQDQFTSWATTHFFYSILDGCWYHIRLSASDKLRAFSCHIHSFCPLPASLSKSFQTGKAGTRCHLSVHQIFWVLWKLIFSHLYHVANAD